MNLPIEPQNADPLKPLAGKRALVTGAGRGIGAGIAISLAKAGADVAVNDLSDPSETVKTCLEAGVRSIPAVGDVGDRATVEKLIDLTCQAFGGIDILVSNAAFSDRQLFYQADLAGFEKTIQVCMWGPFYLSRYASQKMIEQGGGGNIVVIGSPHAYTAYPGAMAYNMAKAALDQMARTAAVELAEHRIRVNIVHPGWTDTPGERKFFFEEELQERGQALPLGRLAKPEDIANGVTFLCNPANSYITGATLSIDGGIVLPYQDMFRAKGRPKV